MKVNFNLGIGYPSAVRRVEMDVEENLGFTEEEWLEMDEDEQFEVALDWAWNYIEVYID